MKLVFAILSVLAFLDVIAVEDYYKDDDGRTYSIGIYGDRVYETNGRRDHKDYAKVDFNGQDTFSDFGWLMFQKINEKASTENFVVSPLPTQLILNQIAQTSQGRTKQQISSVTGSEGSDKLRKVVKALKEEDSAREFQLASAFFVNGEEELKQNYVKDAKKSFVDIFNVNFNDLSKLQKGYDRWLSDATSGVLQSDKLTIDPNAKMIMSSAMYFKGDWLFTFPTVETGKFHKADGGKIDVPMMSIEFKKYHYGYLSDNNGEWLSIPYNSTEAMLILLPNKTRNIDLDTLIANTPNNDITDIMDIISKSNKPHTLVNITMPRFKIGSSINLKEPLEKMGIKRIFTQNSEFYPFENNKTPLRASAASQQSVLEVNESGSVGASVSKFSIVALSVQSPIKEVVFTVDRPFLAIIVNRLYRIPYFIAKVSDPTQT